METISLEAVLNSYNVDGELYRCDIKRFVGVQMSKERVEELHKKFSEIRDILNDKRHTEVAHRD